MPNELTGVRYSILECLGAGKSLLAARLSCKPRQECRQSGPRWQFFENNHGQLRATWRPRRARDPAIFATSQSPRPTLVAALPPSGAALIQKDQGAPFRFERPSNAETVVDDINLCERLRVLHERRKMSTTGNQPGQIEVILASVWSAPLTVDSLQVGN